MSDFPLTPGHRLNSATVRLDLHRLLSAFLAIGPVYQIADQPDDPLLTLHAYCSEDEITHLLVSTAVMNRTQLEHMHKLRSDPAEISWKPLDGSCGTLWPEAAKENQEPLSLREASNKIIHATTVEVFDDARPVLRICGSLGKKEWMAIIEVVDYVRLSVRNFDDALG